jgi:dTDP-4-dehydrorhamnose 3,5-epimerase
MTFEETRIAGCFEIRIEPHPDERGLFARTWCRREFTAHGLNPNLAQCSVSFNHRKGTLRGLHYQQAPHAETKVVRCTRGAIYDVVVDLRPGSLTCKDWVAVVLTADQHNMVYVPEGCAHGFLTLADDCEVLYQITEFHHGEAARGVRWDDTAFRIAWPDPVQVISARDRTYPDYQP